MYEEFYGFVQSPFTLAPDPRFLYLSESHEEAITLILQSIRRKEGFIVLTGDIGTGKTTLCRALLEQLDRTTFTSLVLNPFVSVEELLREILLDFGIVSKEAMRSGRLASATKHELISALHEFLLSLVPIHGSGVLIIDEAQHLSPAVLEQIRVISNLETNDAKLLQIVLVGQLNLLDVLTAAEMRQLDQRISLRATLKPLTKDEVAQYIGHRLAVASSTTSVTFNRAALDHVHAYSGGVPRVINLVCDRALMFGAEAGVTEIGGTLVEKAALSLQLKKQPGASAAPSTGAVPLWAWALVLLMLIVGAAATLVPIDRYIPVSPVTPPASPRPRVPVAVQPVAIPAEALRDPNAPAATPAPRQAAPRAPLAPARPAPPAPSASSSGADEAPS